MTWNRATSAVAAAAGFVAGLYGEWTAAMRALLLLMAADYVTGCLCALLGRSNKTESGHWLSSAAYKGLLHKGMIMLVILVAAQLDRAAAMGATISFFIALTLPPNMIAAFGAACKQNWARARRNWKIR